MRNRWFRAGTLCLVLLGPWSGGSALAAEVQKYVWGSGTMGGLWRIGVGAAVQLINEEYKEKYFFTAAASGGGIENMRRMMGGEFDMTWTQVDVMHDAWNGVGIFEGQKPFKEMRGLMFMGDQTVCLIAPARSAIRTFSDLAGKRVSVGTPGSIAVSVAKSMFTALGIQEKVKLSFLSPDGGAQQLKDGHLDAALAPGSPFPPSFVELARSTPLRLIEPTGEEAEKIVRAMSYMSVKAIAPNTAPGENADRPRNAFFWGQYWVAKPSIPDQVIYDIVKITQEPKNKEMLGKVMNLWAVSGPEFGAVAKMGIPIHPGAVKYWTERGVKLPPELVK
ncbi:MAG TPA: TAXI family TRAP transporter solute-binding subunit [Candidatus Methylomirabilis sp.]|nr:TAXI family TRAP transporter solute-binding subunit [Candidatus Methylomirabilis sp.]HSC69702.1 TAXI family TRAP transporter solute-binding subunit [Candidatus Methylomirabilis sp.]